MAGPTFETRELRVPRSTIDSARQRATMIRRDAEDDHRKTLALASRWELYASLLEQGYSVEEANRRAFRPRLEQA